MIYEDIQWQRTDDGMTFWKLKGDFGWSRDLMELKKVLDEILK